ncbi:hypothetical protein B0H14DRAFT_3856383 [Mycena olivaceomarginata]|nr:hypothetical protein B0H14DRAFT_3856383 [Mycena olivaceomarginata]
MFSTHNKPLFQQTRKAPPQNQASKRRSAPILPPSCIFEPVLAEFDSIYLCIIFPSNTNFDSGGVHIIIVCYLCEATLHDLRNYYVSFDSPRWTLVVVGLRPAQVRFISPEEDLVFV